jgi:hypothetical protein
VIRASFLAATMKDRPVKQLSIPKGRANPSSSPAKGAGEDSKAVETSRGKVKTAA